MIISKKHIMYAMAVWVFATIYYQEHKKDKKATRIAITREMKRQGKVWIRIFPDKPLTKKPAEV